LKSSKIITLRVGEVTDDSDPPRGMTVVQQRFDETTKAHAKAASITELSPPDSKHARIKEEDLAAWLGLDQTSAGLVDHAVFESIYNPGKLLLLITWRDAKASAAWTPEVPRHAGALRHRRVRVIRDYGMNDRCEAPQFFAEFKRARAIAAE
jgi:hypothetical protein